MEGERDRSSFPFFYFPFILDSRALIRLYKMPPTHPSHLRSRTDASAARSCRLTALEIRLALAADGWIDVEEGREVVLHQGPGRRARVVEGGLGRVGMQHDVVTTPQAPPMFTHAPWAAREDVRRGRATPRAACAETTAATAAAAAQPGEARGRATASASTSPYLHHICPWQQEGREASWRARLAAAAGGGGGGGLRPGPPSAPVEAATAAAAAPQAWPASPRPAMSCLAEARAAEIGTKRVPASQPTRTTTTAATRHKPIPQQPLCPAAAEAGDTSTAADPFIRAGFDLAIRVLGEARTARWG